MLYVAVEDDDENRRIARISKDFEDVTWITKSIQGINGITLDKSGRLYFAASNQSVISPRGRIYRLRLDQEGLAPEIFVDDIGLVNGLAFSPDERILYYTEILNGVFSHDMKTGKNNRVFKPKGFFMIMDDLDVSPDGTLWVCLNSEKAIIRIKENVEPALVSIPRMGAPSACSFGKGPGVKENYLYITEFGLKGRVLTMNGRGLWALPVNE